jgi:hypothetical protein
MAKLAGRLKKAGAKTVKKAVIRVWDGPEAGGPKGGITQSMLSRWLCCRERFRLRVIEGLAPTDQFNHRMEYGQLWHMCEESLAKSGDTSAVTESTNAALRSYCQSLCRRYPMQQEQIVHWMNVCKTQFPIYVDYWAKHPDVKDRTPLLQEQVFDIPYELPSGRTVRLRGKFDSVDLIGRGKNAVVYLQENKTKSDIDEQQLKRHLGFDLQTMVYLVALNEYDLASVIEPLGLPRPKAMSGIRYNVVRRPLSGGRGSIRKHQPTKANPAGETDDEFYVRLGEIIKEDQGYFFMRWKVEITRQDVDQFRHRFLDNALEELCDWWHWLDSPAGRDDPFSDPIHYQLPYGIYNPLLEGGSSEVDEYLATGSGLGLTRNNALFGELA